MKKILAFAFSLLLTSNVWAADNAVVVTSGSGLTLRSRDVGAGVQSLQQILGDTSGAALATAPGVTNSVFALPIQGVTGGIAVPISGAITVTSGTTTVTQATSSNLKGQFDPLTIATWGLAAASQNVAAPTNGQLVMGQFTTSPTTITTTNVSPLQLDNAGNLLVNIKAGAGSGGTALADEATFTQGATNTTPMGCFFTSSVANLTTGQAGVARCTNDRQQMVSDASVVTALTTLNTSVNAPIAAGPNIIGGTYPAANATGGGTVSGAIAPATPAGVNLKASAGTVYGIAATTIQATPVYVKFYNSASAPTCGSGTPVARIMIPAASTAANGAGTNLFVPVGIALGTGIGYCVTGALADADTTAITANNTLVNIIWN